ncbi:MAG: hypothetical protein ABIG64_03375 [Candidatus Omnitrophota bacterium]
MKIIYIKKILFIVILQILILTNCLFAQNFSPGRNRGEEYLAPQIILLNNNVRAYFEIDRISAILEKQYTANAAVASIKEDYRQLLLSAKNIQENIFHIMTDKINLALKQGKVNLSEIDKGFMFIPDISEMSISRSYPGIWVPMYVPEWNKDKFKLIKEIDVPQDIFKQEAGIELYNMTRVEFYYHELKQVTSQIARLIIEMYYELDQPDNIKKLITICGIVAAGKTGITKALITEALRTRQKFWKKLETDDYKHSRQMRRKKNLKGADALNKEFLLEQVQKLLAGEPVRLQKIDKISQEISFTLAINAAAYDAFVLEGAYAWFWPELEKLAALKISVIDDAFSRLFKKEERDRQTRGYTPRENLEVFALAELEEGPLVLESQIHKSDIIVDYSEYLIGRKVKIYKRKQLNPKKDSIFNNFEGEILLKEPVGSGSVILAENIVDYFKFIASSI